MMNNSKEPISPLLLGAIGIIVLLVVIIAYTYTHKPFSPDELLHLILLLWRVLIVAGIISLGGGIGSLVSGKMDTRLSLSQAVIQAALGLGIISVGILTVGSTVGLPIWLLSIILLVSGILTRKQIRMWWQAWSSLRTIWNATGWLEKSIAVLAIILLICNFLVALAPPFKFDALTYHLSIPKTYLLNGQVSYLPNNMYWGMPEQIEMLYTLAMRFGGGEAAVLLGWGMGFLALTAILDFTRITFGKKTAWVVVSCLLAGETISSSLGWGYVEWPVMLYGAGVLICLSAWRRDKSLKSLVLASAMAGMSLAIKYTTGIIVIAGAMVILSETRTRRLKGLLLDSLVFMGIVILILSPWMIKNALATGNPFYPFFFPSGAMDAIRLAFYQDNPIYGNWLEMLILPWQVTVWGVESKVGYSASIGPLLMAFSLFAWLGWHNRNREQKTVASTALIIVLTCFIVWGFASRTASQLIQTRLYVSMLPAWALLAGMGFESLAIQKWHTVRFERLAGILVLMVISFNVFQSGITLLGRKSLDAILGLADQSQYLTINLGDYASAINTLKELPSSARVLMLWETMDYYCLPNCDGDEIIDHWHHARRLYGSVENILLNWKEQGYTHLLVNDWGLEFVKQEGNPHYTQEDWEVLDALLTSLPLPADIGEDYRLFAIK